MRAADAISRLGTSKYASIYGGLTLDGAGHGINIYLTQVSSESEAPFQDSATEAAADVSISFSEVPNSAETIQNIHQQITAAVAQLERQGIHLVSFGPNPATGLEDVVGTELTNADLDRLNQQFGEQHLDIKSTDVRSEGSLWLDRTNDSSPWAGGDIIGMKKNGVLQSLCSLGFGIKYQSGGVRSLTAAHCSDSSDYASGGWTVRNTNHDGSIQRGYIGRVNSVDPYTSALMDVGIIGDEPCGCIWTGPPGSPVLTSVQGGESSYGGQSVCSDGAQNGESCGLTVTYVDRCVTLSGTLVCSADTAVGSNAGQEGDSGGPVYHKSSGNVWATGTIVGGTSSQITYTDMRALQAYENNAHVCSLVTVC